MLRFLKKPLIGLLLLRGAFAQVNFDCDPCIERDNYKITAIVHGFKTDPFWQQIEAAMEQAAVDTKVGFSFWYSDVETNDMDAVYDQMATRIESAAKSADALIVTMPDRTKVQTAVETVIKQGTPVFGFESGYEDAKTVKLSGFIGMDDELAGNKAAEYCISTGDAITRALFVQDSSNAASLNAQDKRQAGFTAGLANGASTAGATVEVKQLGEVDASLAGCPYEVVVLASVSSDEEVSQTLASLQANGCADTMLGTFGTSSRIHQEISAGKVKFAISQQPYLQGAWSVVHAALYITTGKHLAPSSESPYGMVLSGPEVITKDNAFTDTLQICEADAFPVCPNSKALDGTTSQCGCTDRSKMKIAGVLHAVTTDSFWDIVYTAANQAADDFGVALELDRMEPDTADVLHLKMAGQIEKLCKEGVDGIFVTIPSEAVLDAIETCQKLKVPVVSINAGPDFSKDLGLQHHIGMVEFNAGYLAGQRMVETGKITKAVCLDHAPGNIVLINRCGGFKKAMDEGGVQYLGNVTVPDDNAQLYVSTVEDFVKDNNNDDWSSLGVIFAGGPQHGPGILVKDAHPEIVAGAFDTSDELYEGIKAGKIMFGMDQGPYLQGYLPIPLLAWQSQTTQNSINHLIESGPDFVSEAPSAEKQTCEAEHFKSCDYQVVCTGTGCPPGDGRTSESKNNSDDGNEAAIISLSIVAVVCALSIGFLAYRVHMLKKYLHRMEEEGGALPQLSGRDYVASAFWSPEKIIGNKEESKKMEATETC